MTQLLHSHLAQNAKRYADKDAFRINGEGLNFSDLHSRSEALAAQLADLGIGPGDKVGIYMQKCLEMPVAVYGVLAAGACFVPLDAAAPTKRTVQIIEDCDIRVLISTDLKSVALRAIAGQTDQLSDVIGPSDLSLGGIACHAARDVQPGAFKGPNISLDDPCYVLFTSGSTGVPKGMVHTHRSALAYSEMAAELYDLTAQDRMGNHAPLHFDMATLEFFAGLSRGATVVMVPEIVCKLPASMSQLIADELLTTWYSVPFALIQLEEYGALEARDLSSLRWVVFAGAPMSPKHLNSLQKRLPSARFSNAYGPAEANAITYYHLPTTPHPTDAPVPIGFAVPGCDLALSEDGELLVATEALMTGYHNRPVLNAEAFLEQAGRRYYKTGDIVQKGEDGCFHYLGRLDRQVKLRGQRIELDEVELALSTHPGVSEVAVVLSSDGHALKAFVTRAPESDVDAERLARHARLTLPPVAVPADISVLEDFSRTTTGKIDRKILDASL